ncbi:hypothetical protein PC9H_002651 [Pleurotus ostreatus]|uniref:Extracellular membrane protein CFEM domain-containing protein n=1 Tax=Pleurotus ostreatus TaxID=5322 RepID=A0A8H6ZJW3_PLEOS|nr:uncharacterized protein PC9H_002651 [Pleurotus ostreatus]KAF7416386.1 hypothetical protein PC9H_002651 [Pleurotus ostreatus]KAJ8689290.1 hypothetical protein PTI98_013326 [Pleurotus ostreatus]
MLGVFTTMIIAIAQVTASSLSDALQSGRLRLQSRQVGGPLSLSDFPPDCQAICTPAVNVATNPNCQTFRCECTATNTLNLQSCLYCVAFDIGGSLAVADASVQTFVNECATNGFPIPGFFPTTGAPATVRPPPASIRSTGVFPTSSASSRFSFPVPGTSDARETPTSAGSPPPQNTISPSNVPSGLPVIGNGAFVPRVHVGGAVFVTVMPVLGLLQYI